MNNTDRHIWEDCVEQIEKASMNKIYGPDMHRNYFTCIKCNLILSVNKEDNSDKKYFAAKGSWHNFERHNYIEILYISCSERKLNSLLK